MSPEVFLRALAANRSDDAARLVYADWLDEQGESRRAEYLRTACALPPLKRNDPEFVAGLAKLAVLADEAPADWEELVCRPHAVILESIPPVEGRRRAAVVTICQATGLSLYHGMLLVGGESRADVFARRGLPKVVAQGLKFGAAETLAQQLRSACGGTVRVVRP
ncbi:MAG TPA: TIGR02996 domain-containing protein [Pirellulales bacterium]